MEQLKFNDVEEKETRTTIQYESDDKLSILNSKNGNTVWVILDRSQLMVMGTEIRYDPSQIPS